MLRFLGWWLVAAVVYGLMSSDWALSILFGGFVAVLAAFYPWRSL